MLGNKRDLLFLKFEENYFYKGDIITCGKNVKLKILETPHKKWWKQLFQILTFGVYKAPTAYKCKVIE